MGNKTIGMVIGVVVIVTAAGLIIANNNQNEREVEHQDQMMQDEDSMMEDKMDSEDSMMEGDKMMDDGDAMMEPDSNMDDGDAMMQDEDSAMQKSGFYKDYSASLVEAEQKLGNKVVLFFHAPWCPFCIAANSAFNARLDEIPSGVTVLKTDYDSNTELKQKYGVFYQHTFVQIDSQENLVTKWTGGDIDNLKKYLQ
ncbi:MAG: thioredoxin family protein [bacterium]|nr:thioredoxin family protein [bacterium]